MNVKEIQTEAELEVLVMGFIDVLDRTRAVNDRAMEMVPELARTKIAKDNELLLDLRNRLWKQFQPLFVSDNLQ